MKLHDGVVKTLTNVWYVPQLSKNLISVGTLEENGYHAHLGDSVMKVTKGSMVVMKAPRFHKLYFLEGKTIVGTAAVASVNDDVDSTKLWHMRLGHAGEKALQGLMKQGLLKGAKSGKLDFCEHCVLGKQTRVSFGTAIHQTRGILDYVHSDVWGPTKTASLSGRHWYVTFIDDYSRRVWVYTMMRKNEVLDIFSSWKKLAENETGKRIKALRTDNGGEYTSRAFQRFCRDEGIKRHFTVARTPQQNGVAERLNRTLLEKVRCMLAQSGMGKEFWAEAITYACHIINRLPSAVNDGKTPYEVWTGKPAFDYDKLHIFGCPVYFHVTGSKLDPRASKALFVGLCNGVKGYRLWCPELKRLVISRDVTFDEAIMLSKKSTDGEVQRREKVTEHVEFEVSSSNPRNIQVAIDTDNNEEEEGAAEIVEETEEAPARRSDSRESIAVSRQRRVIRKPGWQKDFVAFAFNTMSVGIPSNFQEANSSSESEDWSIAMGEEMNSLLKNNTWELVQLPTGKRAIGCKWVYTKKEGFPEQSGVRFKARLVAKGYAQREGIDYNEIFSPVVKHCSVRIMLAMVAQFDLELVQLDVKTAFLHGDLNDEIYMSQPDGYHVDGKEDYVCRLKKSLYGLKQSPRQWYLKFDEFMRSQKYKRSDYDHCIYFRKLHDGCFIYLLLYVDDMLIASNNMREIEKLKTQMSKEFEMKDLGEAKKILGMEITRNREQGMVCLTQKQYLEKLLKKFGVNDDTRSVSTPLASHFKLSVMQCPRTNEEVRHMSNIPYSSLVGSLMYAMVCSRPDIAHAVGLVSRYMHNPGMEH